MQARLSLVHGLGRFPSLKYFLNLTDLYLKKGRGRGINMQDHFHLLKTSET